MCGGGWPKLPAGLDQWLYALPYGLLCLPLGPWAILAYAGAFLGKRTGHGNFMDLGRWTKPAKPERLEFLIDHLKVRLPAFWYDAAGLALTGIAVTIIPGIILAFHHPAAGAILALSGATKAPAYMIGRGSTERGEFMTGILAAIFLIITQIIKTQ